MVTIMVSRPERLRGYLPGIAYDTEWRLTPQLCLRCNQWYISSATLDTLPSEIHDGIAKCLDKRSLACLARTCRRLRTPAESVLFQDISIHLHDDPDFLERCDKLSPSLIEALKCRASKPNVIFTHHYERNPDSEEAAEVARMLAIQRACASGRLQSLTIWFAVDAHFSRLESEYMALADCDYGFLEELHLVRCSWLLLQTFVIGGGSSLRYLSWTSAHGSLLPCTWGLNRQIRRYKSQSLHFLKASQIPNLTSLDLRTSLSNSDARILLSILEELVPQLQKLELAAHDPRNLRPSALWTSSLPKWTFLRLRTFSSDNLPAALYLSIISACPLLTDIGCLNVQDMRTSLLDTLPTSVQQLGFFYDPVWLCSAQDPLDTLVERFRRLENLRSLPKLCYKISRTQDAAVASTRAKLLAHFDALGLELTQDERADFLENRGSHQDTGSYDELCPIITSSDEEFSDEVLSDGAA